MIFLITINGVKDKEGFEGLALARGECISDLFPYIENRVNEKVGKNAEVTEIKVKVFPE